MKLAHSGRSPGRFFFGKDENTVRAVYQNKRYGVDNRISEECTTTSFEDGRGVLSMNKILKLPQSGASSCIFLPDKSKTLFMGCFKRKNTWRTRVSQRRSQTQVLGTVEVFLSRIFLKLAQSGANPCVFSDKTKRLKILPTVAEALAKL